VQTGAQAVRERAFDGEKTRGREEGRNGRQKLTREPADQVVEALKLPIHKAHIE
jgi:hypothetical protein